MKKKPGTFRKPKSPDLESQNMFSLSWRWPEKWSIPLYLAWMLVVLVAYYHKHTGPTLSPELWRRVLPQFWNITFATITPHLSSLLKLAFFIIASYGLGHAVISKALRIKNLNFLEDFAFGYGTGIGVLGTSVLILNFLGYNQSYYMLLLAVISVLLGIPGYIDLWRFRGNLRKEISQLALKKPWNFLFFLFLLLWFSIQLLHALLPELFYDSLVYHLALPSLYISEGRIVPTPGNVYSGTPLHMEMLYQWALVAGDEILAKLMHWSTGLGLAAAMLGFAIRLRNAAAGWIGCTIFFSTPIVGMSIHRTGVETGSSYMTFLAVYALALSFTNPQKQEDPSGRFWLASALFTGWTMGMKYTNWTILIVILFCLLYFRIKTAAQDNQGIKTALILKYAGIALLLVSPWILKNIWFYKNPLFPYFHEWWQPGSGNLVNWRGLHGDAWGRDWSGILSSWNGPIKTLLHPWYMTMKTGATDADFTGPLFLAGLPLLILLRPENSRSRLWLMVFTGLWLFWWPVTSMPRFFMPGLALMGLWIALGISPPQFKKLKNLIFLAVIICAADNFFNFLQLSYPLGIWSYINKGSAKSDYLKSSHSTYPSPYYASAVWINNNTPQDARILIVGDARGYYVKRPFVSSSVFNTSYFVTWLKSSSSPQGFRKKLKDENITYLLVNVKEILRLKKKSGLEPKSVKVLDEFWKLYVQECFKDLEMSPEEFRWSVVYRLLSEEEAMLSHPAPENPLLRFWENVW